MPVARAQSRGTDKRSLSPSGQDGEQPQKRAGSPRAVITRWRVTRGRLHGNAPLDAWWGFLLLG